MFGSYLFQGLKVFDDSVESFTSGAWLALGNALKGGTNLVQKYVTLFIFPFVLLKALIMTVYKLCGWKVFKDAKKKEVNLRLECCNLKDLSMLHESS